MKLPLNLIKEFKTTYLNYGSEFWTGKKCNICQEQFTLEDLVSAKQNHSQKQIELIFCETSQVNEHFGSQGVKVKWYHKSCLGCWNEVFKKMFKNYKSDEIPL